MMKFYKEKNFVLSPIGKMPRDWIINKLGERSVAEIIMGQSPSSSTYNKKGIGLPFLQGKTEFGEIYPSLTVFCSRPIKIAEPNDILLSVRAPVGSVNIAKVKSCVGRGISAIRANKARLNHFFLFYCLKSSEKRFSSLSMGSTFKAIRKTEVENFSIPIPPIKEQQKIAEILSVVTLAIQKTNEIIAKSERLKNGLMQELLTKGIGHQEFKDTPIGKIPREWQVVRLGDITTLTKGKTPKSMVNHMKQNTLPYLNAGSLRTGDFKQWVKTTDDVVQVSKDDVLLIWDGFYCGDAFTSYEGVLSSTMVKIGVDENRLNKKFLFYVLKTHFKELNTKISGMYLKHVNKNVFESLKIPLPSFLEQQRIIEVLSTMDMKLMIERNQKLKLERIKLGLMDLLLTGRIRVRGD